MLHNIQTENAFNRILKWFYSGWSLFPHIVLNFAIEIDQQYLSSISNISDPVEKDIKKYQKQPTISLVNKMVSSVANETSFSFTCVTVDDISQEIK